jgi:hypothetical protein
VGVGVLELALLLGLEVVAELEPLLLEVVVVCLLQ